MDDWKTELPEDLRETPLVKEAKDIASLAKQAVDFQRMLGNSIRIPSEDASPDAVADFRAKAERAGLVPKDKFTEYVRPTTPDAYGLQEAPQDAQALGLTQTRVDGWKAEAHALGLSPGQFTAYANGKLAEMRAEHASRQERFQAADEALRKDWGEALEQRKQLAMQAAQKFGGDELVQALGENPDPSVIKALGEIGKQFAERGLGDLTPKPTFAEAPEEASLALQEILSNPNHPFNLGPMRSSKAAWEAAAARVVKLRALSMGHKPPQGDFMFEQAG